jgi:hypothetical protein
MLKICPRDKLANCQCRRENVIFSFVRQTKSPEREAQGRMSFCILSTGQNPDLTALKRECRLLHCPRDKTFREVQNEERMSSFEKRKCVAIFAEIKLVCGTNRILTSKRRASLRRENALERIS